MNRFRKIGRKVHLLACLFVIAGFAASVTAQVDGGIGGDQTREVAAAPESSQAKIAVIQVTGGIFSGVAEFFFDAVERAQAQGYDCLVVELDTPGGGLQETQEMVKKMLNAEIPVVVFVSPKGAQAASAGTFITMAAHVAVMAPGTRIGAAHPVMYSPIPSMPSQGEDTEKEKQAKKKRQEQMDIMMEKVTNDTVSFIIGVAKERGRNEKWAEKAVRESVSITADEAVKERVVDLIAENLNDLLEKIDGRDVKLNEKTSVKLNTRGATLDRWEMSLKQKLFTFLSSPNIFWLLLLIGIGGIGMEFYHPGSIFPGALGALALILAAISSQVLPISLGGLVLVLIGIGMMVAEVYVTSYGLLGVGGAVLMVMGGIFLIDPSSQPHYMDPNLKVDWSVMIPMVVILGLVFLYVGYYVVRSQRKKVQTGTQGMLGLIGEARSDISSEAGKVFVRGEHWQAVSEENIPSGSKVEVIRLDGLLLHVKKKN